MNKNQSPRTPLALQIVCVLMASIMGCRSAPLQNTWRDGGATRPSAARASLPSETWGEKPEPTNTADPAIAPGFLLTMRFLTDNKLNGDYRVELDGDLSLPYDVTVNTLGLTLSQVKKKLADAYRPYFKTSSDIELRVKERRYWLDVRGLVEKPGHVLVDGQASLDLVIRLADGLSKTETPQYVRIQKGQKAVVFDLSQYYAAGADHPQILGWLGGEVISFQKEMPGALGEQGVSAYRPPVYVLGEVRKPGAYTASPGSDFVDSLVQAGGFTEKADTDNIEIIRRINGVRRVYDFSWKNFRQAPPPVQGDVIMVYADNPTKAERKSFLVVALISALASVVTAAIFVLAYNKGRI